MSHPLKRNIPLDVSHEHGYDKMGVVITNTACVQLPIALKWLEGHTWAVMKIDYDSESSIAYYVRWQAWGFPACYGAGKTLEQALRRCIEDASRFLKVKNDNTFQY